MGINAGSAVCEKNHAPESRVPSFFRVARGRWQKWVSVRKVLGVYKSFFFFINRYATSQVGRDWCRGETGRGSGAAAVAYVYRHVAGKWHSSEKVVHRHLSFLSPPFFCLGRVAGVCVCGVCGPMPTE